jgi:hypothetical protein
MGIVPLLQEEQILAPVKVAAEQMVMTVPGSPNQLVEVRKTVRIDQQTARDGPNHRPGRNQGNRAMRWEVLLWRGFCRNETRLLVSTVSR